MKCNLTSLIDALKLEFPLETCGDMALQISDLQGLTPDNPPTRPDVLYTIEQNQLLRYQGAPAKGPVLCIGHTGWTLRHSQASFPALILVLCTSSAISAALERTPKHDAKRCCPTEIGRQRFDYLGIGLCGLHHQRAAGGKGHGLFLRAHRRNGHAVKGIELLEGYIAVQHHAGISVGCPPAASVQCQ